MRVKTTSLLCTVVVRFQGIPAFRIIRNPVIRLVPLIRAHIRTPNSGRPGFCKRKEEKIIALLLLAQYYQFLEIDV